MRIFYSSGFLKSFRKLSKEIRGLFQEKEILFQENPFNPKLKTHKLKGKNEWSFLITYKIRVIFIFNKNICILVNIGDHSIYRKSK